MIGIFSLLKNAKAIFHNCQIDKDNSITGVGTTTTTFAKTAHLAYPIAIVLFFFFFFYTLQKRTTSLRQTWRTLNTFTKYLEA